jgi:hypothetical protein
MQIHETLVASVLREEQQHSEKALTQEQGCGVIRAHRSNVEHQLSSGSIAHVSNPARSIGGNILATWALSREWVNTDLLSPIQFQHQPAMACFT